VTRVAHADVENRALVKRRFRPLRSIGNRGRDRPWSFRVGAAPRADPNVRV
jgi:hypothetical protein